jgi:hypothetical protein
MIGYCLSLTPFRIMVNGNQDILVACFSFRNGPAVSIATL